MRLHKIELPYHGKLINIEPLGDTHIGNSAADIERLKMRINHIRRDENRYWIGMGDYMDNIRPWRRGIIDKRWETNLLEGEADWVVQWDMFTELVKPISGKCLGVLWGNHEWASYEEHEFERMVRKDLGVPFLGARAMILVNVAGKDVVKKDWYICAVHGDFGGYNAGGALNAVKNLVQTHWANIYLYGHTHFKTFEKGERVALGLDGGRLVLRREPVLIVLTGGFIDPFHVGVDQYYDRKPRGKNIRVGSITVAIDPVEVKLHAFE